MGVEATTSHSLPTVAQIIMRHLPPCTGRHPWGQLNRPKESVSMREALVRETRRCRLLLVVDEDPECRGPSAPDLRSSLLHFTGISIYFESEAREPEHKSRLAILVASNLAHFVACHSTATNLTPLAVWWPASILQHATSTIFASIDTEEWLKDYQLCILGPIMCRVAGFLSGRHRPMQSPWAVTVV